MIDDYLASKNDVKVAADEADLANAFVEKFRNVTTVTGDYTVQVTDGIILTDTTGGDLTVTLHPVADGPGYSYEIKQILGSNNTLIVGSSGQPVDDDVDGITIDRLEALPVKNDKVSKWWINN